MAGIYIHIPFCKQACSYCDFYFLTKQELRTPYVDSLVEEIKHFDSHPISEETIETIYIGGGTPSLLTMNQLEQIFTTLDKTFKLKPKEVTLEMNPDDVTPEYLNQIQMFGVDRASMGVQSFDEDILRFMHRAHDPKEALKALEALQLANFPSYTADLIYGNPGQSLETLSRDIDQLLAFNPPHISAYSLTVESGTRLGKEVERGVITPASDDTVADHFDLVREKFSESGIEQYEVSNFAKPGKEAIHNSNYWRHHNYLGLGPSAHSLFWPNNKKAERWKNRSNLKDYLNRNWENVREEQETLNLQEMAEERIMLGLRTKWGVSMSHLKDRYGYTFSDSQKKWLQFQSDEKKVNVKDDVISFTPEGLRIADHLVFQLITK